jgi:hypothetical protein
MMPSRRTRTLVIAAAMVAGAASVGLANLGGLDLTPNSPLPYGPIGLGSQETRTFMLSNGVPSPTAGLDFSFTGPGSGAFRFVTPCTTLSNGMPCSTVTGIPGGEVIPVDIRCEPPATGTFNVTVHVNTTIDGNPASDSVQLVCTANSGGGGSIIVTPGGGHGFGNVEVNTTSLPFEFDLENDTGLDPLDNIDISVGSGFVLGAPCPGAQQCLISPMLAQGGHLPIEVRAAPTELFTYNSDLTVSVGSAAAIDTVPISVTATPPTSSGPELSLDTSVIAVAAPFGQSGSQPVVITNEGVGDLHVTLSIIGPNAGRWSVFPPCTPCTIPPGPTFGQIVTFQFDPSIVGDESSTLRLQTDDLDDGENDFTLSLTGTGTGGVLSAPSGTFDLGQVRIGNSGATQFQVGNVGIATALPVSVSTTAPFDIPPPSNANVAVGVPETFTVQCTPTAETMYSEDVTIAAPTAFGPLSAAFEVRCEGVISDVTITPSASWDFGGLRIGQMATKDFEITNVGADPITYAVPTVALPFTVVAPTVGGTLQPTQTVTVTVQFAPTAEAEAAFDVTGLLPSETDRVIHVVGHGTIAAYTVTPPEVDLGTACVGDTLMTPVTLEVTGTSVLHVEQPDVVGDSVFTLSSVAPGTLPRDLAPDESIDAIVRATPAVGEHRATLVWGTDLTAGDQTAVTLAVSGIEQGLAASPGAIDFGEVLAAEPASRAITVRVCATEPLSVTAILEGDAGFQLVGPQEAMATSIASEPWTIVFAPSRRGEHTAVLRLVPEAGAPIDIELSGTNVDAGITNYYSCGCNADTGGLGAAAVLLALALAGRRRRPCRR